MHACTGGPGATSAPRSRGRVTGRRDVALPPSRPAPVAVAARLGRAERGLAKGAPQTRTSSLYAPLKDQAGQVLYCCAQRRRFPHPHASTTRDGCDGAGRAKNGGVHPWPAVVCCLPQAIHAIGAALHGWWPGAPQDEANWLLLLVLPVQQRAEPSPARGCPRPSTGHHLRMSHASDERLCLHDAVPPGHPGSRGAPQTSLPNSRSTEAPASSSEISTSSGRTLVVGHPPRPAPSLSQGRGRGMAQLMAGSVSYLVEDGSDDGGSALHAYLPPGISSR